MESRDTPIFLQKIRYDRNAIQKTEEQDLEKLGNIFLLEKLREEKKRIDDLEELVIKLIMYLETTTNDKILNKVL